MQKIFTEKELTSFAQNYGFDYYTLFNKDESTHEYIDEENVILVLSTEDEFYFEFTTREGFTLSSRWYSKIGIKDDPSIFERLLERFKAKCRVIYDEGTEYYE